MRTNKPLTQRMQQIVDGIAAGKDFKAIGVEHGLSPSTVSQYAWRLLQRYDLGRSKDIPGELEFRSWS